MPLVEIVPAPWTAPDVVRKTRQLLKDIGQSPVTLNKEVTGFIQPRIQFAILQEALRLVVVSTHTHIYLYGSVHWSALRIAMWVFDGVVATEADSTWVHEDVKASVWDQEFGLFPFTFHSEFRALSLEIRSSSEFAKTTRSWVLRSSNSTPVQNCESTSSTKMESSVLRTMLDAHSWCNIPCQNLTVLIIDPHTTEIRAHDDTHSPFLGTRSKASSRSTKTKHSILLLAMYFSCSWQMWSGADGTSARHKADLYIISVHRLVDIEI